LTRKDKSLATSRAKHLWKKKYFQTAILIALIFVMMFGFWFGLRTALNTDYPLLAVASGSMSTVQPDDEWLYPFTRTLHTGDLIIVQGVNDPQDIYAAPFNDSGRSGDILVFRNPDNGELIVHRAIGWYDNETIITKGDGNSMPGPPDEGRVPVSLVIGKVILRIPWIGQLGLLIHDQSAVYLILGLIIIIIAVELIFPIPKEKKPSPSNEAADKTC
jgi:signal peptidase I